MRVRDELRMTIEAYQALYESAIAYGMRKALLAEQRRNEMNSEIKKLEDECNGLDGTVNDLENDIKNLEKTFNEKKGDLEKTHKENMDQEKGKNQLIKDDLQRFLSAQPQGGQDKGKSKK